MKCNFKPLRLCDTQLADGRMTVGGDKQLGLDPQGNEKPLWYIKVWVGVLITSSEKRTLAAVRRYDGRDGHRRKTNKITTAQITEDEIYKICEILKSRDKRKISSILKYMQYLFENSHVQMDG